MKMNNQEIERFEHHVGDMYNILINISTELNTIKVTQKNQGGNSQNLFGKLVRFFVTLGLKILRL